MPQSLVRVYLHLVFSTKDRQPFLRDESLRSELHAYLAGACKNQGVSSLQVGGVEDHVHICCQLSKTLAISDLIGELKRESSKWIKPKARDLAHEKQRSGQPEDLAEVATRQRFDTLLSRRISPASQRKLVGLSQAQRSGRTFIAPPCGGWLVIILGIDRLTGPVRILSVVLMIRYRHTGNNIREDGPKLPYQAVVIRQSAKHRKAETAMCQRGGMDPHTSSGPIPDCYGFRCISFVFSHSQPC